MTNVLFEDLWGISSRLGASLNFPRNMLIKTGSLHLSEQACFEVCKILNEKKMLGSVYMIW